MTDRDQDMSETADRPAGSLPMQDFDRAQPEQGTAMRFVRDHPVAVIAGGLAIGVIAAAFIPRRNRKAVGVRASALAELATAAGLAFGREILERANETGIELKRQGTRAAERAEAIGESARSGAGRLGVATADRVERLVTPVGRAAAAAGGKLAGKAESLTARLRR